MCIKLGGMLWSIWGQSDLVKPWGQGVDLKGTLPNPPVTSPMCLHCLSVIVSPMQEPNKLDD